MSVCISNGQIFDKVRSVVKIKGKEMKMKNSVRVYKTSKLYTSLYGRAAYEAWNARETEIDALRMRGKYSKKEIAKMYEDNLRLNGTQEVQVGAISSMPVVSSLA